MARAREEAVGDGAERLAQPVAVGEAGAADGRDAGARLGPLDEALDRVPERRARWASACRPSARSTRARSRPRRAPRGSPARRRQGSSRPESCSPRSPRRARGSRSACARPRSSSARACRRGAARRSRRRAGRARGRGRAPLRPAAPRRGRRAGRPRPPGPARGSGRVRGEAPATSRRRLDERVVGDPRLGGVPAAAAHAQREGRAHLLRRRAEVEGLAAEHDPLAAPFVERVVGPHRVGVFLDEPFEAEAVADLLVGGRNEDQVACGPEALARERGERDRRARRRGPSCRARRGPRRRRRRDRADQGSRDHSRGSASTVSVWQRRASDGPSPPARRATRFARSGTLAYSSASTPLPARYSLEQLGGVRLVPGRVRRVHPDERPGELRHLVPEPHQVSFESAVSSFRASQSSG